MKVRHAPRAFTLIELLVVIAIIAILAAILFPVFARAKEAAKKTKSLAQMQQLSLAVFMYAGDNDDMFVPSTNYQAPTTDPNRIWCAPVQPYVKNKEIFVSPAAADSRYAEDWSTRNQQSIGLNGTTAIDMSTAGCDDFSTLPACEGWKSAASFSQMEEAARVGLFAETPNGPLASKYRGYVISGDSGGLDTVDVTRSIPLVADRDLVAELGATLAPAQLKPIFARYGRTGRDEGVTPVIFGDGHAKHHSAKSLKVPGRVIWRFR